MAIGNLEFEYGHEIFAWQNNRTPFPVLGANFFYKGTDHPFAQAHAIIERNDVAVADDETLSVAAPGFLAEGGKSISGFENKETTCCRT